MPHCTQLSDLRCDQCGSPDIVAVRPGMEEQRSSSLFETWHGRLVLHGERMQVWCMACWCKSHSAKAEVDDAH